MLNFYFICVIQLSKIDFINGLGLGSIKIVLIYFSFFLRVDGFVTDK